MLFKLWGTRYVRERAHLQEEIKYGKTDQMSYAIAAYDIRDTHSSHSSFPNQICGCGSPFSLTTGITGRCSRTNLLLGLWFYISALDRCRRACATWSHEAAQDSRWFWECYPRTPRLPKGGLSSPVPAAPRSFRHLERSGGNRWLSRRRLESSGYGNGLRSSSARFQRIDRVSEVFRR